MENATNEKTTTSVAGGYVRQFNAIKDIFEATGETAGEQALLSSYHLNHHVGGGPLVWAPEVLKSAHDGIRVFSPTVPTSSLSSAQASIISYMNSIGETDAGGFGCWLRLAGDAVAMEYGGVTEGVDCGLLAQRIMDACVPNGTSVICSVRLTVGSQIGRAHV